jgi:hypothetical protein
METSTIDTPAEESLLAGADPASAAPAASTQPPAADAGTPTQPAAGFVNPDGTFSDKWLDALPEDAKEYKDTLAKYKSVPDMAKALANANQLIGKKLGVPNEKSTPEEVAAYRKALGIPDTLDDYKFAPDQLPEGMEWSDEFAKPFAEIAHQHNIPPGAMKALANQFTAYEKFKVEAIQATYEKQRGEAVQTLRKEWGGEFEKNIGLAKQAAKMAGVDANSHGFSDPEVVRMAVRLAGMMSEDRVGRGASSVDFLAGKARAQDIMKNPDNPWHKRYQDGDPEAAALVTSLLRQG